MKKKNKGYTLIELMIVVVILVILVIIAAPQIQKLRVTYKQEVHQTETLQEEPLENTTEQMGKSL